MGVRASQRQSPIGRPTKSPAGGLGLKHGWEETEGKVSELGPVVAIVLDGLHAIIDEVGDARAQFAWK